MTFKIPINIQANSESEAKEIAQSMEKMSSYFNSREWKSIAKKLENKINRTRIKIFIG